jgi:hypothetical protein
MVDQVQEQLEAIYGIHCEARVRAFLLDDESARKLGATGRCAEELLVVEGDGELEVGLYLSAALLERMRRFESRPLHHAQARDFHGYCQLAEGVSHFLYFLHTVNLGRRVSLLELEAQAEIDKFASCVLQRWGTVTSRFLRELHARLFDRVSYLPTLSADERWRYEHANRLSRNYCARLFPLILGRKMDRLLAELRHTYRLGAAAKLQYLAA